MSSTSSLRVERNPWVRDDHLHEALLLRGAIVSAIGQVETLGAHLAIHASKHPAYVGIRTTFPTRREPRWKYLRAIADAEQGPLFPYRGLLLSMVGKFEGAVSLRDLMAHGQMRVYSDPDDRFTAELGLYRVEGDLLQFTPAMFTRTRLLEFANTYASFARAASRSYERAKALLPPLDD